MADLTVATRAIVCPIEAGAEDIFCPADRGGCGREVKFLARIPSRFRLRVIANVYFHGQWNRTEQFHCLCYIAAGMPYGYPSNLGEEHYLLMLEVLQTHPDMVPVDLLDALVIEARSHPDLHIVLRRRAVD